MNQTHRQWLLIAAYICFSLFCGLEAYVALANQANGAMPAAFWLWSLSALLWFAGCAYLIWKQIFGNHLSHPAGSMKKE
jgi:hypothetical protein